jgi:hypothetical protein
MKIAIIIAIVIASGWLAIYLYNKYYKLYQVANANPEAVHAIEAGNRYVTDIAGLIHATQVASQPGGDFMSRLGSFVNALPGR